MKAYIDRHVAALPYSQDIINQLQENMNGAVIPSSSYYAYPLFFTEFFPEVQQDKLEKLCAASFFIFMFVSLSDKYLDIKKNTRQNLDKLNLSLTFYDEGIKLLEQLFEKDSRFWETWHKRRHTFLSVGRFNDVLTGFSREDYFQLAAQKSELGKLAIDTLHFITACADEAQYQTLLTSHDYFSIGFQLLDDIEDFSKDVKNQGQTNFILNEMIRQGINTNDAVSVNEAYFNFDILEEAATLSIAYFNKAKETAAPLIKRTDSQWLYAIEYKKKKIDIFFKEIQSYKLAKSTA